MSEVSLKAAYGVYMQYAPSNSMEGLLRGIAEGRRLYGPPVSKIFSFKDVTGTVQLFYCQEPGEEQRALGSPHTQDLETVYSEGNIGSLPGYLTREFNALRAAEAEEEANRFKILQPIRLEQLGEAIQRELKERRWGLRRSYFFNFAFMFGEDSWLTAGDFDERKYDKVDKQLDRLKASLTDKGFECRRYATGGKKECVAWKKERFSVLGLNKLGEELAELTRANGNVQLSSVGVERSPVLSRTGRIVLFIILIAIIALGIFLFLNYRS